VEERGKELSERGQKRDMGPHWHFMPFPEALCRVLVL